MSISIFGFNKANVIPKIENYQPVIILSIVFIENNKFVNARSFYNLIISSLIPYFRNTQVDIAPGGSRTKWCTLLTFTIVFCLFNSTRLVGKAHFSLKVEQFKNVFS